MGGWKMGVLGDPIEMYYRHRAIRGTLDPDVAAMQIHTYANRDSAVSALRRPNLDDIRPRPLKYRGPIDRPEGQAAMIRQRGA